VKAKKQRKEVRPHRLSGKFPKPGPDRVRDMREFHHTGPCQRRLDSTSGLRPDDRGKVWEAQG
ncbi:MAG: hypothetical protein JSU63_17695, partial [Phycisphaerales bacterium]